MDLVKHRIYGRLVVVVAPTEFDDCILAPWARPFPVEFPMFPFIGWTGSWSGKIR